MDTMDRDVQTLYNPPCVCRISADIQCLWCPDAGIHPGRWCTCQVQWILRYPAVVPRGDGRYIRGTVGICVGCLGREIDRDRTATQRLDTFTDLFDRLTVSIMRHMGAWTRTDRGRPVLGGGDEPPTDMTTTVESEMHGIIALSSRVDDRFRDGARVIRPTTGTHRIRPVEDGRLLSAGRPDFTSVAYRVEPYDSAIGYIIGGGFRRRGT